jgi:hypothetical protein
MNFPWIHLCGHCLKTEWSQLSLKVPPWTVKGTECQLYDSLLLAGDDWTGVVICPKVATHGCASNI